MKRQLKSIWRGIQNQSKNIKLPLFEGLSLYDVTGFFFMGIVQGRVTNRAASIAYSFFIALFPGIIFIFSLIAYLPIQDVETEIFRTIADILPPDTYESVRSTIDDVLKHKRPDLLSLGFLFALIFATNGINSLISNFSSTIHKLEQRVFWKQQLVSIALTIALTILFIIGMMLIVFSSDVLNSVLEFFNLHSVSATLVDSVRYILMLFITLLSIALLYNIGPSKGREWRFISPGAILATVLILLASFGFSYYVSHFSQYNKLYGSIGTLLVILLWIYVNALLLIIGFELNASMASAKVKKRERAQNLNSK